MAAPLVAFVGSRRVSPVRAVSLAVFAVEAAGFRVATGCARGVDAVVRSAAAAPAVFAVASGRWGRGRGAFAARSVALVRAAVASGGGALVAFPAGPCPAGVSPARSWRSGSPPSGSWSAVALAVGLGLPVFVGSVGAAAPSLPGWGPWRRVAAGAFAGLWALAVPVASPLF